MLDRVRLLGGERFQQFCALLLSLDSPLFQAVNGAGGDRGNDGFLVGRDTVFQAYGPEKESLDKVRKKVDESLLKAAALRASEMPQLQRLVFLTPFDLTHEMHMHLQTAAAAARLSAESWGQTKLTAMMTRHPTIRAQFPEIFVPDVLEEIRRLRGEVVASQMANAAATRLVPSLAAMISIIVPAPLWFSLNLFNT